MFTCAKLLTGSLALWLIALAAPPGARSEDWPDRIRALVAAGKLADAMQVVEQWKAAEPGDFEARTWHARVEAWQGHMREADQEFRLLLQDQPGEPALLVGLAGVLNALRGLWHYLRKRNSWELLPRSGFTRPKPSPPQSSHPAVPPLLTRGPDRSRDRGTKR